MTDPNTQNRMPQPTNDTWYRVQRSRWIHSIFGQSPRLKHFLNQSDPHEDHITTNIDDPKGFYITGKLGTGKTVLGSKIILDYARQLYITNQTKPGCVQYVTAGDIFQELKSTYKDDQKDTQDVLDNYYNCQMLMIDDLGASKRTEWSRDKLFHILNKRYDRMKPVIITSNYDLRELIDVLDDIRIPNRISRQCVTIEKKPYNET